MIVIRHVVGIIGLVISHKRFIIPQRQLKWLNKKYVPSDMPSQADQRDYFSDHDGTIYSIGYNATHQST